MGQALYRKYRSKSLNEIIGQEHITQTLEQALKTERISHAYLFTGPKGVGKTSIARILAHEINDLPYTDDSMHMDIIEIDAASNRRIDEIRELREKVYVAPTSAKYKVYIIDEVHMLTKEAFNALLKTLEEPPAHVIFILATTDAHKLPETIISRTQRFQFRPVELAKVVAHLKDIAKLEKITVSDDALELLAAHGEGSFRDSISLLDQASSHGQKIERNDIEQLLGIPPTAAMTELATQLAATDVSLQRVALQLAGLYNQGFQAAAIAKQLGAQLRLDLLEGTSTIAPNKLTQLLIRLLEVPIAHDPERFLEIILFESLPQPNVTRPVVALLKPITEEDIVVQVEEAEPVVAAPQDIEEQEPEALVESEPVSAAAIATTHDSHASAHGTLDATLWPDVLTALKKQYNTLYGVVRMAQPTFGDDGTVQLAFAFAFHQKRLNDAKHRQILADIIKNITGKDVSIVCIVDKNVSSTPAPLAVPTKPAKQPTAQPTAALSAISNIFGGAELLE